MQTCNHGQRASADLDDLEFTVGEQHVEFRATQPQHLKAGYIRFDLQSRLFALNPARKIHALPLPLGVLLCAAPRPVAAQSDSDHDRIARLERQVEQLTAELAALRVSRDSTRGMAAAPLPPPPPPTVMAAVPPLPQVAAPVAKEDEFSLSKTARQPPSAAGRALGSIGPSVTLNASTAGGGAAGLYPTSLHQVGTSDWYADTREGFELRVQALDLPTLPIDDFPVAPRNVPQNFA